MYVQIALDGFVYLSIYIYILYYEDVLYIIDNKINVPNLHVVGILESGDGTSLD